MKYALVKNNIVVNTIEADETFIAFLKESRQCDEGVQSDTLSIGDSYTPIDTAFENAKLTKTQELREACNKAICIGFTSAAAGTGNIIYSYDNTSENPDQNRIKGYILAINNGYAEDVIYYKGKGNQPFLTFTHEQFKQLCKDAFAHETSATRKYFDLAARVEAAQTSEEVAEITW